MSPKLFIFYLDRILQRYPRLWKIFARHDGQGFADDLAITVRSWSTLRKVINDFRSLAQYGLILNEMKCDILTNKSTKLAADGSLDSDDDKEDEDGNVIVPRV